MNTKNDFVCEREVHAALNAQRGKWPAVAKGSGISISWLSKYSRGEIPNPGYVTLQRLGDYLKKQKLLTSSKSGKKA